MALALILGAFPFSPAAASTLSSDDLTEVSDFRLDQPQGEAQSAPEPAQPEVIAGPEPVAPDAGPPPAFPEPTLASYGPQDPAARPINGASRMRVPQYASFGSQLGAVKWEMAAIFAYYTAINGPKLTEDPEWPHFHTEGWFGKSTRNIGVDKLAHAYSAYVLSELIYGRLKHKTGNASGIEVTAAVLGSATMLYSEFWDSIESSAGWSWEDVTFNTLGAGLSVLRNSVPGLDQKLDYRLMIVPNDNFINVEGKRHFEQQRYFFALKLAGFKAFEKGPLRFLELHAGYYATNFTNEERAAGIIPKQHLFVGFGINLRELFFKNSRGTVGRAAGEVLDYFQPPYTAVQVSLTN